jgi:hypothetical protein
MGGDDATYLMTAHTRRKVHALPALVSPLQQLPRTDLCHRVRECAHGRGREADLAGVGCQLAVFRFPKNGTHARGWEDVRIGHGDVG